MNDENNIRKPDKIIKEKLINNDDEDDEELKLALSISENEYYENNSLLQFQTLLELSKKEYDNNIMIQENKLMQYEENLIIEKMNTRIKSLENFSKKIQRLNYSDDDKIIKNYINNVLQKYYKLEIDYIIVEPNMYKKIFNVIDNYYLNCYKKNFTKFAISKEEDEIIRKLFIMQF